jgi:hypothetical protein
VICALSAQDTTVLGRSANVPRAILRPDSIGDLAPVPLNLISATTYKVGTNAFCKNWQIGRGGGSQSNIIMT